MHAVKWLQAESVIYDHCAGNVKKNRSTSTAVISRVIFTCLGQAGPVFRLDHNYCVISMSRNTETIWNYLRKIDSMRYGDNVCGMMQGSNDANGMYVINSVFTVVLSYIFYVAAWRGTGTLTLNTSAICNDENGCRHMWLFIISLLTTSRLSNIYFDRSPVPVISAVQSNITFWSAQNLSNRFLNTATELTSTT